MELSECGCGHVGLRTGGRDGAESQSGRIVANRSIYDQKKNKDTLAGDWIRFNIRVCVLGDNFFFKKGTKL